VFERAGKNSPSQPVLQARLTPKPVPWIQQGVGALHGGPPELMLSQRKWRFSGTAASDAVVGAAPRN